MNKKEKVGVIIVAAGESRRMGGIDKMMAELGGLPLLVQTTRPFQESPLVSRIIVVVSGEKMEKCRHLVAGEEWDKVSDVCVGGERRQDSVAAGLKLMNDCDWIIVHDGARPLVTREIIEQGLEAARETGATIAAVPVTDTIKIADENGMVMGTPPRRNLWLVQTPQVFRADIIRKAYQNVKAEVTDDAMLVERLGYKVKLFRSTYDNIKVTTREDLALAQVLWEKRHPA